MGLWLAGVAFATGGAALCAEAREPLIVARLGDPEAQMITTVVASDEGGPDQRVADFARALAAANADQQRKTAAECRDLAGVPREAASRMAWETNCRYRRR